MPGHADAQEKPAIAAAAQPEVDDFGLPIRIAQKKIGDQADSDNDSFVSATQEVEEKPKTPQRTWKGLKQDDPGTPSKDDESMGSPLRNPSMKDKREEAKKENMEQAEIPDPVKEKEEVSQDETKIPEKERPATPDRTELSMKLETPAKSTKSTETTPMKNTIQASEYSYQTLALKNQKQETVEEELEWQEMPAYAPFDIYNDDGKLVAREAAESDDDNAVYANLGGAGKGYTRVQDDEDAQSATSMDDNTAYLFKEKGTNVQDEHEEYRDPLAQMQTTKGLLTEGQRIAYVGIVRLSMFEMIKDAQKLERTRAVKNQINVSVDALKMWSQKMIIRLYSHMDIEAAEQVMIEQLSEHGVQPGDLTPSLMQNARVKNPIADETSPYPQPSSGERLSADPRSPSFTAGTSGSGDTSKSPLPPPYKQDDNKAPAIQSPMQLPNTRNLDIDLRWTVLCDLFLVLISDSIYDARSRRLLEISGGHLDVPWIEICRFEKRVTDALEMQESANKENWNEDDHMENRRRMARNKRLVFMGLATVGGGLVIGLSAGLLAPVIGAGLAAGFTTIGVAGTGAFLGGAGGAAIVTTTGIVTGGTIGVRAANRRTGAVRTFEYRPLHNNKRVNLVVTVSGWMNGKVDDVRLPFSTVDPLMGDIYSVFWEPDMLRSMGDTINILATEALTQGLQQVLGSTILVALMASLQAPILLTKLSYLIDNPWAVSQARADLAGLILADSLIDRNLGARPVTLVGFSLGSRVIFSCLRELASKAAFGLVQNVYMFGTPVVANKEQFIKAKTIVSGRFVNGFTTTDWILGYLFRATGGGIMSVAGLTEIDVPGIENFDCTEFVAGHMAYRTAMPRLLRECGWMVESDEFSEIEDPDPENHEKRQRELINEIEEARKELEKKPARKRFGLFGRNKKLAAKKDWELYDERTKGQVSGKDDASLEDRANGVLFDLDAIQREVAELAAEGIEVKQLESTLPPIKVTLDETGPSDGSGPGKLRETQSFDESAVKATYTATSSGFSSPTVPSPSTAKPTNGLSPLGNVFSRHDRNPPTALDSPYSSPPTYVQTHARNLSSNSSASGRGPESPTRQRPPLYSASTAPVATSNVEHNAWADDDEFGHEKEIKMTFA